MRNFLFSLIFVLLSCPLWSQQQSEVLHQMEHRMHNDSIIEQNINPYKDQMTEDGMDFFELKMQNSDLEIRMDSIYYLNGFGKFKERRIYDSNGNRINKHEQKWINGEWVNFYLYTYTYDFNSNLLTSSGQRWEDGEWVNSYLSTRTYDSNSNILTNLSQCQINNEWVNSLLISRTYDSNSNILTYLEQNWINGELVVSYLIARTYDSNSNILTYLRQSWENGEWVNSDLFKYTYTYDSNNNIITRLIQIWRNDGWDNTSLSIHTYDSNNNLLTHLVQTWSNDKWENLSLITYTYDSNSNILTWLGQIWENGELMNSCLLKYTYDSKGNLLKWLRQTWNRVELETIHLNTRTYDSKSNLLISLYQNWENGKWKNDEKYEFIYLPGQVNASFYKWDGSNWIEGSNNPTIHLYMKGEYAFYYNANYFELYYTVINDIEAPQANSEKSLILCFPNPASDHINIEIDESFQAEYYSLELFNLTGQKIKSINVSSDIGTIVASIRVDDVPPGLYLLRIEAGKQIFSQKIIISK